MKYFIIIVCLLLSFIFIKFFIHKNYVLYKEDMIYGLNKRNKLIAYGIYENKYEWCVMNLQSYPTCYVRVPEDHIYFNIKEGMYKQIPIKCHGGLTYYAYFLYLSDLFSTETIIRKEGHWIGWDYGHNGDFCYMEDTGHTFPYIDERVYTTDILIRDCVNVCKQLVELDKK